VSISHEFLIGLLHLVFSTHALYSLMFGVLEDNGSWC
jgi:hypothetical protein